MKPETQKILDDLKKAGFNTSSIEQQIAVNPVLDKASDMILGDGILRQSQYTVYMNQFNREKADMEKQIKELATAHDSHQFINPNDATKLKESLDYIKQLEDSLIATGQFTEESVRSASMMAGKGLQELIDNAGKAPVVDSNINNNNNANRGNMPDNFDPTKFVDATTLNQSLANVGMGSVLTARQISVAEQELARLGIQNTPDLETKLQQNLFRELSREGGSVQSAFDLTYDLPTIRATKQKEAQDKLISDAFERGKAEAAKDGGIPSRNSQRLVLHPIIDRNSKLQNAIRTAEGDKKSFVTAEGNIDPAALPKNEKGEVNRFMLRGDRASRVASAKQLFNQVEEHYLNDPTYVE